MKKIILFIAFILLIILSNAQTTQSICVTVDCKSTIKYPATSVTLNGTASSPDGIKSVKWTLITGASTIVNPNVDSTSATLNVSGLYVYLFTATSTKGAVGTGYDSVNYVSAQPPVAIVGNAILDSTANSVVLSGSNSTDPNGLPITYLWTQTSGPNVAVISSASMANPIASGLVVGTYVFKLTVTNSANLSSSASQSVTFKIVQIKTTVVTTKYFSDGSTQVTSITTVP